MNKKKNVVDVITMVFTRISSVVLLLLIVLMAVNVIGRRLFNAPISGTIELVEYGMLVCIALAISRTGFEGRQLSVTMIQKYLPPKPRAILKCICNAVAGVLFGSLIFEFINVLPKAISSGRVSDVMHIPYYLVYCLLVVAMFMVSITFFYQSFMSIYVGFFKKEDKEEVE